MGVTYSDASGHVTYSDASGHEKESEVQTKKLRSSYSNAEKLINAYFIHQFQPVMEIQGLLSLFHTAFGWDYYSDAELSGILESCLALFQDESSIVYTQEVLVIVALLCDAPWNKRAGLLFSIFKCIGIEEMGYEDFMLAAQVVAVALCRLWHSKKWSSSSLTAMSEVIADNAFTKLEKDLDENVRQEQFIQWAVDRFKESKTIASSEALKALYSSAI